MDLDSILPSVGEFGKYQKLVIWLLLLPAVFPCIFHAYNQIFMASVPDHWCKIPGMVEKDMNILKNQSIPLEETLDGHLKFSQCSMYHNNTKEVTACSDGWEYENDVSHSIVSEWNLVCDKNFMVTLSLVLFSVSGLVGNYIFGYIQDGMGRKPAHFIYLLILCFFGILTAFSTNYWMWNISRIGVGFTVPAILSTPYVLAIELVGPKDRTIVTILINIACSLALVSLSIIVWAIRDWRWLAIATTAPFLVFFTHWWILPESPRWLLSQGRFNEAEKILLKMAKINGKNIPISLLENLKRNAKTENSVIEKSSVSYGIKDLFRSKNLRWKTIIITFLWFTNTSVYVGLSYYAPSLGGDEYLNFFLAGAVEFPTYLLLWPSMERLGRRWTLCISMIIGGISCLATVLVQNDHVITLGLYCVGKMGISSSFVVLPLMASELYPTVVRGLGMSVSSMIGVLGPIFIPFVNYLGTDMLVLPLMIMGTLLIMGGASSLLLPETLNQHLPQTLQDAENAPLDCFGFCVTPQLEVKESTNLETLM